MRVFVFAHTRSREQVKQIEARDSVLTSDQQINRLLRSGSTYFNLNPFEVLQIEPETPVDLIKKRYRSLSILVHPDKNQNDKDRAQLAFEVVNKAWKTLENDATRKRCLEVYEEAKDRTDHMVGHFQHFGHKGANLISHHFRNR